MANAPHPAVRRAQYAADLGEKGSGKFPIIGNYWLDIDSEKQKVICPSGTSPAL
jgi:hypothetical protein